MLPRQPRLRSRGGRSGYPAALRTGGSRFSVDTVADHHDPWRDVWRAAAMLLRQPCSRSRAGGSGCCAGHEDEGVQRISGWFAHPHYHILTNTVHHRRKPWAISQGVGRGRGAGEKPAHQRPRPAPAGGREEASTQAGSLRHGKPPRGARAACPNAT